MNLLEITRLSRGVRVLDLTRLLPGGFATGEVPEAGKMMLNGTSPCYQVYECLDGKFLTVAAVETISSPSSAK